MNHPESTPPDASPVAPPTDEQYPFWSYRDLAMLTGLALPSLLTAALLVKLATALVPGTPNTGAPPLLAAQFLGYGIWFLCLYGLLRVRYGKPFWQSLAWIRPPGSMSVWLVSGPILAIGVVVLGLVMRTPEIDMPIKDLLSDPLSVLLVGLFATTLGPVCEELVFRGFVLPLVVRSFGAVIGIVLTALPFALLHGPQYAWSWRHLLLITLAGVAFGWVRHGTRSTAAAAVTHATYNLTFFIAYVKQWGGLPTQW